MAKCSFLKAAGLVGAAIGSLSLLLTTAAFAQAGSAAQGIQLSPSIIELNAQPGGTYVLTVEATNVTAGDLNYKISTDDFTAKDETGAPSILQTSSLPPQVSVRTWVSSVPAFNLLSHQSGKVTFRVTVPTNAEPGGHYGVLDFSGTEPKVNGTGVGLSASAGTLLLVKVAGDIQEKAEFASFYTASSSKVTNFFETAPVNFVTRIQNTGNIHVKPFGFIEVKNMFGSTVATLPVNVTKSNVLPNSIRRFDNSFAGNMFGPYTATVTLGYGTQGEVIMASTTFWVIPYRLIGTILLVLAFVLFILRRLLKAYNKRVIKKFQNIQKQNTQQKNESKKTKR
ncbi:MAG TPA: hypothetical protein VMT96_01085 [Candidatus Bathyarchaeia archaeon]|nr:hypothetical protein [Candidatus Bathyarchaeia archaeon]